MRTYVLSVVAALALVVTGASQPASTATKAVKITASAFSPASVSIKAADAVKWTNSDTKSHQVVANNGAFASPTLAPGKTYTHTFSSAGTYRYHDALHPSLTGKVVVTGPPPAVTLGAAAPILTYGQSTHVSGAVSNGQAGETVTVWAQPYGQASPVQVAMLQTTTNGVWDYVVEPGVATAYEAHWKNTISSKIAIQVRPQVLLSVSPRSRLGFVKVKIGHSLEAHTVYLQRLTRFQEWIKIKSIRLSRSSSRLFHLRLRGRYRLRAYITVNQAGPGYLDAWSRTVLYRHR
jgi:plastocyanin